MLLSSINIGLPTKSVEDSSFIHSWNKKDDLKLQTLVHGLGGFVTQDYRRCHHFIQHRRLPIHLRYMSLSCTMSEIWRLYVKKCKLFLPLCFWIPRSDEHNNFAKTCDIRQMESLAYNAALIAWSMIHSAVWQKDGRTNGLGHSICCTMHVR